MKKIKYVKLATILLPLVFIMGCDQNDGPAEKAGERLDQAAEEVKDAGTRLKNDIEDTCEDLTKENC